MACPCALQGWGGRPPWRALGTGRCLGPQPTDVAQPALKSGEGQWGVCGTASPERRLQPNSTLRGGQLVLPLWVLESQTGSLICKMGTHLVEMFTNQAGAAIVLAWPLGWCEDRRRKKQWNSSNEFLCLAFRSPSLPPSYPDFISGCQSGAEGQWWGGQRACTALLCLWWTQPLGLREKVEAEVQDPPLLGWGSPDTAPPGS